MSRRGQRFLGCPDCGKRGVYYQSGSHQDGGYQCRYCDFWVYEITTDRIDKLNTERLNAANPEMARA